MSDKPTGLYCPSCGKKMLHTLETRPIPDGIKRRKECVSCKARCTTVERIKAEPITMETR